MPDILLGYLVPWILPLFHERQKKVKKFRFNVWRGLFWINRVLTRHSYTVILSYTGAYRGTIFVAKLLYEAICWRGLQGMCTTRWDLNIYIYIYTYWMSCPMYLTNISPTWVLGMKLCEKYHILMAKGVRECIGCFLWSLRFHFPRFFPPFPASATIWYYLGFSGSYLHHLHQR